MTIAMRFIIVFLSTLSIFLYYSKTDAQSMFCEGGNGLELGCGRRRMRVVVVWEVIVAKYPYFMG